MLKKFILKKSEFELELKNFSQIPQINYMEIQPLINEEGGQGTVYACEWQNKNCAINQLIFSWN